MDDTNPEHNLIKQAKKLVKNGVIKRSDIVSGKHCIAPACLKISITRSLANIGVSSLDLLYLHNAAEKQQPVVGKAKFMQRLRAAITHLEEERKQGRIASYGMATSSSFLVSPSNARHVNLQEVLKIASEVGGAR